MSHKFEHGLEAAVIGGAIYGVAKEKRTHISTKVFLGSIYGFIAAGIVLLALGSEGMPDMALISLAVLGTIFMTGFFSFYWVFLHQFARAGSAIMTPKKLVGIEVIEEATGKVIGIARGDTEAQIKADAQRIADEYAHEQYP